MGYKKNRTMKVYEICDRSYKATPQIKLQGQWLEELGFSIGTSLCVKCLDGQLVITPLNEFVQEN